VEHIVSAYPILATELYMKRHDRACAQIRFNACEEKRVKLDNGHWYDVLPKSVETSREGKVTIL